MFDKVAEILGKLNGMILLVVALGIVALTLVLGIVFSLGGDLGKFKKVAKKVIKAPTLNNCNATAKQLPIRARKQYKTVKQTGCKPDDAITPDACVYAPFKESVASHLPGAVMAAGVLSILFAFFAMGFVKETHSVIPCVVTLGVMVFRLLAGLVSTAILKGGIKAYNGYVSALSKVLAGGAQEAAAEQDNSYAAAEPVRAQNYSATFDAPERITVELADEETEAQAEVVEPVVEEPVVTAVVEPVESEAEAKARARAEAMAAMRAEQAAAQQAAAQQAAAAQAAAQQAAAQQAQAAAAQQAAAQAAAAQQAAAQAAQQAAQTVQAQPQAGSSSADEVIARIETIKRDGAPIATMKEVALMLQKERAKPENKTPEMQRKLNEALASLLKAMSSANKR